MIREKALELKKDFSYIKKYIKFWGFIFLITGSLVLYNQYFFSVDRKITELTKTKNQTLAENLMLKKEISRLSSPKRIGKIARSKLKMKDVDYSKVHFIDTR